MAARDKLAEHVRRDPRAMGAVSVCELEELLEALRISEARLSEAQQLAHVSEAGRGTSARTS